MGTPAAYGDEAYPRTRAARDRFVLRRRGARPSHDPFTHQGVIVEDERGLDGGITRTATVLLTGRECPWRCVMCDLWQYTTAADTPPGAIPRQVNAAVAWLRAREESPSLIKLYNAGSFFDRRAVPPCDDEAIVQALDPFSHVVVESHPLLVGDRTWRMHDTLAARNVRLEVAMGLETAHPTALDALNKGVSLEQFAAAAGSLRAHGVLLRVFVLVHPPFVPVEERGTWLGRSVAFADACHATAVSLIPTRTGEGAMRALVGPASVAPPRLRDVEQAAGHARTVTAARVFVDLWNVDALAACSACAASRRDRLHRFNLTQVLDAGTTCAVCGEAAAA